MKRHKLQLGFVYLTFLVFFLPWRHVSTPDCKAPPERCFIPILLVTKANCKFCTALMFLYRFLLTWCVSLEWHTNLSSRFYRVWHCFIIMLHFTYHELFADEAALSSLTPTSSSQSTPLTQLKIRTYKIQTFFQGWHWTVFCCDSDILYHALLCLK